MHGITMIFLFVIPMTTGAFGNYLIPLMIGARDMAFPRLNAVSYWIFLGSGLFMYVGLVSGHAPNSGWFDYVPLASKKFDPGNNIDFYGYGLIFNGISSTAAAINIIVLPAFGIATSIIPTFVRRKMVFFPLVALAEIMVAFLGFGVWVHHMFATGLATITTVYFAAASLIIVIPSAIQLFAWITTILTGTPQFKTPLLFIIGFIIFFIIGGLSGVTVAAIPFDQQVEDSYYVVAHFHFVIFGAAVFPILGGMYYWFPKVTGRMYHEGIGKVSFYLTFVGTLVTFFPMHLIGILGMPRRVYTYPPGFGWTFMNFLESVGSCVLATGLILFVANLAFSLFTAARVGNDPFRGD